MRPGIFAAALVVGLAGCAPAPHEDAPMAVSPDPVDGWIDLLAAGLDAWEATGRRDAFSLEDGVLYCDGSGGRMIYYAAETFQNFVFEGEVKVSEGANSGVFLRVADPMDEVQTGFEVQVLDSYGKEEMTVHDFGAIYDIAAPAVNAARPPGEWNRIVVTADGPLVKVVLNEREIIDVDFNEWIEAGRNPDGTPNKFNRPYREMVHAGYIGLQDHGNPVWYQNLRVRSID